MENEISQEQPQPKQISLEDIIKEGESIYPNLDEAEKKSFENNKINNWLDIFYNIKKEKSIQKFNELVPKSEHKKFFEGLNYEYGINNKTQDVKKAFEIYKDGADNDIDAMCMYKLYHIYKNEFIKFNIQKQNRILEKFYLFKTFSFLNNNQLQRNSFLCNKFDIKNSINFYLI